MGCPVLPIPRLFGIQARSVSDGINASFGAAPCVASDSPAYAGGLYGESVSDGIGVTIDATSCVASDPPAYAGGLYGESVSDGMPSPSGLVRRVMRA